MTNLILTLASLAATTLELSYEDEVLEVVSLSNEDGEDLLEELTPEQEELLNETADETVAALGGVYARHSVMSSFTFTLDAGVLTFTGNDARWEATEGDTLAYEANGGRTLAEFMTDEGITQLDFVKETDRTDLEVLTLLNGQEEFAFADREELSNQEGWELDEELLSCLTEALSVWDAQWDQWEGLQGTAELKDGKVELHSVQKCDWTDEKFFHETLTEEQLEEVLS